jgi:hypothetical protein
MGRYGANGSNVSCCWWSIDGGVIVDILMRFGCIVKALEVKQGGSKYYMMNIYLGYTTSTTH